eukprot:CAMPEP_0172623520 /NCGR_PEP_ID=MMETSP1068-20121228/129411_1 /TAXON_ID=35684 /ORGANISM="Pseudopedinella elastica, Strain CCMP716" /LENGTH=520 /DNA_ID=CAMNT_0013432113 /DNA_START=165 /DNA_END=1727 /DNA_ORIENTATION=+
MSDSEEERRRRKKEKKKEKKAKKAKEPKLHQLVGYTNDDNPFGDTNLSAAFVWKKKAEKDGSAAQPAKNSSREKRSRDDHFYEEIQKVRKRRQEREEEMEEQERLRAEEARLREAEQYADWHQKEESFHLEQARVRSKIRLVEGREKPIDILAKNIILLDKESGEEELGARKSADTSSLEVELREPTSIFEGLEESELAELLGDIRTYQELEGEAGPNVHFWKALEVVCLSEVEASSTERRDAGVHSSVLDDITKSFADKSSAQLEETRTDIQGKLDGNDGSLDVEFWEGVLKQLQVFKARAQIREFHHSMLKKWLEVIEEKKATLAQWRAQHPDEARAQDEAAAAASKAAAAAQSSALEEDGSSALAAEAKRGLEDLEEELGLSDEVKLGEQAFWWADKYRPRKPRYFNRVRTGYEWNKYNQTHYDHDNPPPKTVQGYKFSIFYPDLIDRSCTPKYICEPADTKEFMILRFTAGPPYEDVAFKLVNREWEFGRKAGFRASFERGVLSLFFNFKRHRYRK